MTRCFLAGRVEGRECGGRQTDHHVVSKQRIRRAWRSAKAAYRRGIGPKPWSVTAAIADERNRLGACFDCHIGLLETGHPAAQVKPSDLKDGFWDFVEQYGLRREVPSQLHLQEAAA